MLPIVGSKKQEDKISELGAFANQLFPGIETMIFKGSFRYGIKSALEKKQYSRWEEVAEQHPMLRKKFFQSILDESIPHLKAIGLYEKDIDILFKKLKEKNEKYLNAQ